VIKTALTLLATIAAYGVNHAQELKLGETIVVSNVTSNNDAKPDKGVHLFKADRGNKKGELLLASDGKSTLTKKPKYTTYQLIGADKIQTNRPIGILGIHYIKVKPERSNEFEKFVVEKLHPAVGELLPDMQLLYYKATKGENTGSYVTIFGIESTGARDKYWPAGEPETEILKQAFQPLNDLAAELGTYLVDGSFLEPGRGAAAYFESKEWTDFILQK
jgi:hypothetical protein